MREEKKQKDYKFKIDAGMLKFIKKTATIVASTTAVGLGIVSGIKLHKKYNEGVFEKKVPVKKWAEAMLMDTKLGIIIVNTFKTLKEHVKVFLDKVRSDLRQVFGEEIIWMKDMGVGIIRTIGKVARDIFLLILGKYLVKSFLRTFTPMTEKQIDKWTKLRTWVFLIFGQIWKSIKWMLGIAKPIVETTGAISKTLIAAAIHPKETYAFLSEKFSETFKVYFIEPIKKFSESVENFTQSISDFVVASGFYKQTIKPTKKYYEEKIKPIVEEIKDAVTETPIYKKIESEFIKPVSEKTVTFIETIKIKMEKLSSSLKSIMKIQIKDFFERIKNIFGFFSNIMKNIFIAIKSLSKIGDYITGFKNEFFKYLGISNNKISGGFLRGIMTKIGESFMNRIVYPMWEYIQPFLTGLGASIAAAWSPTILLSLLSALPIAAIAALLVTQAGLAYYTTDYLLKNPEFAKQMQEYGSAESATSQIQDEGESKEELKLSNLLKRTFLFADEKGNIFANLIGKSYLKSQEDYFSKHPDEKTSNVVEAIKNTDDKGFWGKLWEGFMNIIGDKSFTSNFLSTGSFGGGLATSFGIDPSKYSVDRQTVMDRITKYAQEYGVDPKLAHAIARHESNFNPNIKDSSKGAMGVMQLMPDTAKDMGVDPRNLDQNIIGGIKYIKYLQSLPYIGNDPALVAAGYNAGPGSVKRAGGIPRNEETLKFVENIMGTLNYLKKDGLLENWKATEKGTQLSSIEAAKNKEESIFKKEQIDMMKNNNDFLRGMGGKLQLETLPQNNLQLNNQSIGQQQGDQTSKSFGPTIHQDSIATLAVGILNYVTGVA
jgi:hypothetical protein